ncbi:MAG: Hpt domain-containing protein, partial [Burkholderiaceae bacterium]
MAKSLFTYDAQTGTLSPVMGRGEVHAPVRQPVTSVPVDQRLIEQAQLLAFSSVREDVPVEEVSRDLERLSHEAQAADQPALAATVLKAQEALELAGDSSSEAAAVRGELSEALVDFVSTASDPVGLDAAVPSTRGTLSAPMKLDFAPSTLSQQLAQDDEMREVFLEEARDVLANARDASAGLADAPDDLNLLTTLRRAFHTLKGSSRMVGLKEFGQAAWACEQLYNTHLADQSAAPRSLLDFTDWSLGYLGSWVDEITELKTGAHDAATVIEAAKLASGEPAPAPVLESASVHGALGLPADLPSAADLEFAAPELTLPDAAVPELVVPELPTAELPVGETLQPDPVEPEFAITELTADELVPAPEPGLALPPVENEPPELSFELDLSALDGANDQEVTSQHAPLDMSTAELHDPFDALPTEPLPLPETIEESAAPSDVIDLDLEFDLPDEPRGPAMIEPLLASTTDFDQPFDATPDLPLAAAAAPEAEPLTEPAVPDEGRDDELVKVVGPLRIGIPLFNIYLNEADELSRRLSTEVAEWALELHRPIGETPIALAHSLAGSSATVGFADLSHLARLLEHAEARSLTIGHGTPDEAQLFIDAAEEIRRLLHQFAAGFLKEPSPELLERLAEHELSSARRIEAAAAAAELPQVSGPGELTATGEPEAIEAAEIVETAGASEPVAESVPEVQPEAEPLVEASAEAAVAPEPEREPEAEPEVEPVADAVAEPMAETIEPIAHAAPVEAPVADAVPENRFETSVTSPGDSIFGRETRFEPLGLTELKPFGDVPVEAPRSTPSSHALVDGDETIDAVDAIDEELFPIFEEEAEELLPQLASRLRDWARKPGDAGHPAACMRTLHTLKGGARLAGAMRLGEMAHRLETQIERLLAQPSVEASEVEHLQSYGDSLSQTFEALRTGGAPVEAAVPVAPAPVAAPAVAVDTDTDTDTPPADAPAAALPALEVLLEAAPQPEAETAWQALPLAEPQPEPLAVFDTTPTPLTEELVAIEEVADEGAPAEPIAEMAAEVGAEPVAAAAPAAVVPLAEIDWSRFPLGAPAERKTPERAQGAQSSVRVRAPLLDRLVNQAGEVSITRSRIETGVSQIKNSLGDLTENLERLRAQLRDI